MKKGIIFLLVLFVVIVITKPVSGNAFPPPNPPGENPSPANQQTMVRMVAETVTIEVLMNEQESDIEANVTADFVMQNTGLYSESMAVRFPIGWDDQWGKPRIKNMVVKVNNEEVKLRQLAGKEHNFLANINDAPAVEFDVTFPPEQDVLLQVSYLYIGGSAGVTLGNFEYIFETGAGWNGNIGRADLILKYPFELEKYMFNLCDMYERCFSNDGVINDRSITWNFRDFDPTYKDNFGISIVAPSVWQQVLADRIIVTSDPGDSEAWSRLGELYMELFFHRRYYGEPLNHHLKSDEVKTSDPVAWQLLKMSDEAYKMAVNPKLDEAGSHALYALLLGYADELGYTGIEKTSRSIKAADEIHQALMLNGDNNDYFVNIIAEHLACCLIPEGVRQNEGIYVFDFPWLTQTPVLPTEQVVTPASSSGPILNPQVDKTVGNQEPIPAASQVIAVTPVPAGKGGIEIGCLFGLLIPIVFLIGVRLNMDKRKRKINMK